ncbi:polynucleotide 5'-hydroxyl-kinase NOL9 [Nephila pilipes]|uniref:Polynucleotide 5'-hydroxyl-kinase NOL9 n=1 Tax=Nephila pilipes TaxID=299642 RepID=A0A8X6PS31_NEPPI|nr:polynucleotide 5'-hydroxyl-kinase NOL9 [Nephila pilipes]
MVKRGRKSSNRIENLPQSDSDNEGKPEKQSRNYSSSNIKSANGSRHSMNERLLDIGSESELPGPSKNNSHYETFESFLKAHSFTSEHEDESNVNRCEENKIDEHEESTGSKKEKSSKSRISSDENMDDDELNISVISIPSKLTEVVTLQHPASLTLHGYIKVTAQLGSISILGYNLQEGGSVNVFSSEYTGLKTVSTLKSVHKSTIETFKKKLNYLLRHDEIKDLQAYLDSIGSHTVVLIVEKALLPSPLQFLELYAPKALFTFKKDYFCNNKQHDAIDISPDYELVAEEVITSINHSENAAHKPRILVYGPGGSGKSTLLRYLINTALNTYDAIYYLDTDPGQTEFTPPGVVSVTKVTEPLLGPPYSHQKAPHRMIFTGSVTASTSPPMYQKSVETLIKLFDAKFPHEILFVNTMGWLEGIGAMFFEHLKKHVNPTMLIELTPSEDCTSFIKTTLPNKVTCIKIPSRKQESGISTYKPKERRDYALLAYLGQCQKYFMPINFLNAFHPVCVCWDNIAIYVMGKKVPPHRLIEAVHCSVVALCHVHQLFMLDSEKPELPRTLFDEPINECIGFGLVRAADEANHLLYIITPLSIQELKKVNAIIKGNIMLPSAVFIKQPIMNVPLPFTNQSWETMTPARKTVSERVLRKTPSLWT